MSNTRSAIWSIERFGEKGGVGGQGWAGLARGWLAGTVDGRRVDRLV